jgi:hypothetical protein
VQVPPPLSAMSTDSIEVARFFREVFNWDHPRLFAAKQTKSTIDSYFTDLILSSYADVDVETWNRGGHRRSAWGVQMDRRWPQATHPASPQGVEGQGMAARVKL